MSNDPRSPFHDGEYRMQERMGVGERMAEVGPRVIRDFMPDQHREFFAQLPFVVAGAVAPSGAVWATVLTGTPGFAHCPDPRTLVLETGTDPDDPASEGLAAGDSIAILGIELHTRRRNRANGTLARATADGMQLSVRHSFGNCPKYIRPRRLASAPLASGGPPSVSDALMPLARDMIEAADTFFVASYVDLPSGERQVDVSHRGGPRGFVRVNADGLLTIPDYKGNLYFNTLGNFVSNPKAGLLFVDFETGDVLQLTGRAEVVLDSPEIESFEGAQRLWTVAPRRVVLRPGVMPLRA